MFSKELIKQNRNVYNDLLENLDKVSEEIINYNEKMFLLHKTVIESELQIIILNNSVLNFKNNTFTEMILSLSFKNIISLVSAIRLIEDGFLGSAKIIFRNVYESLMIGKFMGITKDSKLYNKWQLGTQISIKKDIFQKLKKTPSIEAQELWNHLNKYNHSTIYSQDFLLELDKREIDNCNSIITTLLAMNYHLINSIVSKYYDYYLNYYYSDFYKNQKNKIKKLLATDIKIIDSRCKKIINEYRSSWEII